MAGNGRGSGFDDRGGDVRDRRHGGGRPGSGRPRRQATDLFHSDLAHEAVPRRAVVMGIVGLALAYGIYYLADYQIIEADTYRKRADERRVYSQTLFAKRGTIYDRNGTVITSSVECENVYANPNLVKDVDEAVDALVEILGVDRSDCRKLLKQDSSFVYIKRQVDEDVAQELADRDIDGIELEPAMKRLYPNDTLASQIIGVVNIDNEGVSGLESSLDDVLSGENGWIARERARDGSYIAGGAYEKVEAKDGTDVILTIDANIQKVAEDAIAEAVESSKATYGSALVMDPRTGEILACCSNPTYSPTDLANTNGEDMNLRMVTDAYEPGSVFKTLVCGMGIDLGLISPETTFDVPAQVKVGDSMVSDVDKRDYAMTMTVREILRRSSNTGMVLVGEKIGADDFAKYLDTYEITSSSGIDFPGESQGVIRSRDEYDGSSLGSMSFGQGISVAPVRVARAVASIANGGIMCTPHLILAKGGEEEDHSDEEKRTISQEAADQVTSMMVTVVDEGTGAEASIDGYDVAGKTGTAERADESGGYSEHSFMASFIGFAPAQDPRALVYITLDGTPNSSHAALAPFKTIMESTLSTLNVAHTR